MFFQEKQLQDLADEIRKLKSVIVKQENRIRTLEASVKILVPPAPSPTPPPPAPLAPAAPTNHDDEHQPDHMAPDEV